MKRHAVLMGDPQYFRIQGGANPYTRNRWGFRKRVDPARAAEEWSRLKAVLERLGAKVYVLPAVEDLPGLAFPANAGFVHPKYEPLPFSRKTFYVGRLTHHRRFEQAVYEDFVAALGFSVRRIPWRFEGEADFFPCGEWHLFTFGTVRRTGFRLRPGFPPYAYRYSHRSEERSEEALQEIVGSRPLVKVRLIDVRYYHGDTCLFPVGRRREYLFAYLEALDPESRERLKRHLGGRLIPLSRTDAEHFAANSFQLDTPDGPHAILPSGVSDEVKKRLSEFKIPFTAVDVSEFFSKGGGSVKCMLCDLGPDTGRG